MRKFTMFLATILIALFLAAVTLGETAYAHIPSQGSQGFSPWRIVTWNSDYMIVHHKHTFRGTVCELYDHEGNHFRFRLDKLNANNRNCTG